MAPVEKHVAVAGQGSDVPSPASPAPGHRTALIVLTIVSILNYLDRTVLSILQEPIKRDLHLSDAQLGALTGLAFALFYATLSIPIASLADRFDRVKLIAGAMFLWSLMTVASGFATSFVLLLLCRVGVALGEAGSVPASHSIIADYFPPARRATALGLWGLALPIGVMGGYFFGGSLAALLDWRSAFFLIGGIGVVLAPALPWLMREPERGRFDGVRMPSPPLPKALATLWGIGTFRLALAGATLHAFTLYAVMNWSAPFYIRLHGLTLAEVAFALAVMNGIGGAIGVYGGGWLTDRLGAGDPAQRLRITGWAMLLCLPVGISQFLVPSLLLSLACGLLLNGLLFLYYAPIISISLSLVPAAMRAFTSAIILFTINLIGLGLGPLVTGMLSDAFLAVPAIGTHGIRYALLLTLAGSTIGGLLFLRATRSYTTDLDSAARLAAA